MTKYQVQNNNSRVEFSTLDEANAYISANSLSVSAEEITETPTSPILLDIVKSSIDKAQQFSAKTMLQFAAENVLLGITQAGKTGAVLDYLAPLISCFLTGSLYHAVEICDIILADNSETKTNLSPFITDDRITGYKHKIQDYLGVSQT